MALYGVQAVDLLRQRIVRVRPQGKFPDRETGLTLTSLYLEMPRTGKSIGPEWDNSVAGMGSPRWVLGAAHLLKSAHRRYQDLASLFATRIDRPRRRPKRTLISG